MATREQRALAACPQMAASLPTKWKNRSAGVAGVRLFHLSIAYLTLLFVAVAITALLPWSRPRVTPAASEPPAGLGSAREGGEHIARLVGDGSRDVAEFRDVPERLGVCDAVCLVRGYRGVRAGARR